MFKMSVLNLLFFVSFAAPAIASSGVEGYLKNANCAELARKTLGEWQVTGEWIPQPNDNDGGRILLGATSTIGVWVNFALYPDHSIWLNLISPESTIAVSWARKDCQPKTRVTARSDQKIGKFPAFTDRNLRMVVDGGGSGIIYAWSPHMPLSVKGFREAQKLARKLNLKFIPVLDPEADEGAAKEAVQKYGIPKAALMRTDSIELSSRGMGIHYPSTLVFSKNTFGRLYPGFWVGLDVYEKFIKENLR